MSNQFFVSLITPLDTKATRVWSTRFEAGKKRTASPITESKRAMGLPGFQLGPGQTKTLKFQLYLGPKLYHRLAQLTHDEAEIMDFGLWKLICQALLNLMNFLHSFLHNYALAILVLTATRQAGALADPDEILQVDAPHVRARAEDAGAEGKIAKTTRRR